MKVSRVAGRTRDRRPHCPTCLAAALLITAAAPAAAEDFTYVVRPGDNPWNLTERYLKSIDYWPRLQQYNRIVEPTRIPPGTRLRIPVGWMRGTPGAVRITHLTGRAEMQRGDDITPLEAGMTLTPGAIVRTAADSSLTLQFPDGSRSLVGADAELRIAELKRLRASSAQQVRIELRRGQLESEVTSDRARGGRYRIDTPAATAAVRGTHFRVGAAERTARTETLRGAVALHNRAGQTLVRAGSGSHAQAGRPPAPPTRLLPAPRLAELPARAERLPLALDFPAVPGASAYRTRLALPGELAAVASDHVGAAARATSSAELPDGSYRLRVRAIDARGLEGIDAERELVVDARPEPPFPSTPAANATVVDDEPAFRWARVGDAARYRFQLGADASFATLVVDADELEQPRFALAEPLPPGEYFWRVAVRTPDEGAGPFSDAQRFRRPPPGPVPEPPQLEGDTLTLSWQAAGAGDRYQVQLAADPAFAQPEFELDTDRPTLTMPRPPAGSYHVRVRTEPPGEPPGPWGKPQQIEIPASHWRALLILVPLLLAL